jgi:hypothetical protein
MIERGIDPGERRVLVEAPVITREAYGATPLTISGRPA